MSKGLQVIEPPILRVQPEGGRMKWGLVKWARESSWGLFVQRRWGGVAWGWGRASRTGSDGPPRLSRLDSAQLTITCLPHRKSTELS